jgi:hypothetical protein
VRDRIGAVLLALGGVLIGVGVAVFAAFADQHELGGILMGTGVFAFVMGTAVLLIWPNRTREAASRAAEVAPPKPLQPRYSQSPPYRHTDPYGMAQHRVGIFNPSGNNPAERVRVNLTAMDRHPRHTFNDMKPIIPYSVPMLRGGDSTIGDTVAPGTEELWVIGYTSTRTDQPMGAGGFADRTQGLIWTIDTDERFRLTYRILYEGQPPARFSLVLYPDNGVLRCALEG